MRKSIMVALGAILATALVASPAHATLLGPGATVTAPNAGFGPFAYSGGTVIASFVNEAPFFSTGVSGTLTTEVIRNGGGTLDFLYQVTAATSNTTNLNRVTAINFAGFTTDVRFGTAGLPFSAVTGPVMLSGDRSSDGSTIGWQLGTTGSGGLVAGQESYVLMVLTNATAYTSGSTFAIDGGTADFNSFAPTAVPEPSTMAIAGIGALGMIGYGLRRRKALGA